ncbi:MAG TPA: phage tail tape measure protein, partial [Ktedonobacteraceae bacterium]|nr:phage tail tape measure protein [Ktedonobacteraceae bacterium]
AEALTNVLANFSWQTKDANLVNGEMLETVTLGKATFEQYASTITKASTVSQQYQISLETMSSAWATMTANGIRAAQASTDYQQLVGLMYGKVGTLTKSLEKNGIAFDENAFNAMSFGDKVAYLKTILDEAAKKHVQLTGVTLQAAQAITVIGNHMSTYKSNLATLSDHQAMANKTQQAWAITQSGFAQTMSRVQAALQVVLITIGQQFLPTLTNLANMVLSVLSAFTAWLIKSGALQVGVNDLVGGIQHTIGFIASLVAGISSVIGWFAKGSTTALILRDALIAVGAAIAIIKIGNLIAQIPALLVQLGAWLAATWAQVTALIAEAVAEALVNWPIYLIIAAIAALVAIVILLWTHWGQITKWLQTAWQAFTSWIITALQAIGQFFVNLWSGITSGVGRFFSALGSLAHAGLMFLLNTFTMPFRMIGALFQWLYNHNYYFKALVDKIHSIITAGLAIIHALWQGAINKVLELWNDLIIGATDIWKKLSSIVQNVVAFLVNWVRGQIQGHITDMQQKWNTLKNIVAQAWQAVSSVISGAWNSYIVHPLQNLWNSIVGFANGWPKQAVQWGINMVQGFINGLKSMLGAVGNAASNIVNSVKSFLGFHSPAEQGEGQHIVEWGSGMVKGFSSGVIAAIPSLQAAVNMAVKTGTQPMSPPALVGSVPYGRPPISSSYSSYAGGGNHYGDNSIVIQGAGQSPQAIAQAVMDQINRKYRRSGVMSNLSAGGRDS